MNLTDFQKRLLWGLGILFILILWITFPLIFKEWVFTLLVKPPFTPEAFATLGPIGDIFGGLTAFFTSATLIIVMYSAYLQKEANKDAREAMAEQLKQAREANDEQLKQAKEATYLQLQQAKSSMDEQLTLAKLTNEAQIKESRSSIFSNLFYGLLNLKFNKLQELSIYHSEKVWKGDIIFILLSGELNRLIQNEWIDIEQVDRRQVREKFENFLNKSRGHCSDTVFSYFTIYISLIGLILKSELDDKDKNFYFQVLSNSMTLHEQMILFWISPTVFNFNKDLPKTGIFNQFYDEKLVPFALKFHKKSSFRESNWVSEFEKEMK
ncbi:hypothetical protein [Acinetobacter sp. M5A5_2a]